MSEPGPAGWRGLAIDAHNGGLNFPSASVGTYSAGMLDLANLARVDLTADLTGTLSTQAAAELGVPAGTRLAGTLALVFDARDGVAFEGGHISLGPVGAVPEPSSLVLGALGLAGVGTLAWRRRQRAVA